MTDLDIIWLRSMFLSLQSKFYKGSAMYYP